MIKNGLFKKRERKISRSSLFSTLVLEASQKCEIIKRKNHAGTIVKVFCRRSQKMWRWVFHLRWPALLSARRERAKSIMGGPGESHKDLLSGGLIYMAEEDLLQGHKVRRRAGKRRRWNEIRFGAQTRERERWKKSLRPRFTWSFFAHQ